MQIEAMKIIMIKTKPHYSEVILTVYIENPNDFPNY